MHNEQIERYLLDLLMRLSAEEGEGILEGFLSTTGSEGFLPEPCEKSWRAGRGRRHLREDERFEIDLRIEGLLIELQEMGVLSPSNTERFLEKIRDLDGESITPHEAIRLATSILRTECPGEFQKTSLMLEDLADDMTPH